MMFFVFLSENPTDPLYTYYIELDTNLKPILFINF